MDGSAVPAMLGVGCIHWLFLQRLGKHRFYYLIPYPPRRAGTRL